MQIPPPSFLARLISLLGFGQIYYHTGVVDDPRTPAEKALDWNHEERQLAGTIAAAADDHFSNPKPSSSSFPDEDQQGVGSCVPHGVGGGLAAERKLDVGTYARLSWTFAYRLRSNFPAVGCYLQNVFDIYKNIGAPLFTTLPDPATEDQAAAIAITPQMRTEAAIYKGKNYFTLAAPNDIVQLAGLAALGHAVPILIYATYTEWAQRYPQIYNPNLNPGAAEVRHCIKILPNSGFTENGIRYIAIQDSAHFGNMTLRYLSEQFITARVYGAGYWDTVGVLGSGPRPKHTFTKYLKPGSRGIEVTQLQLLLISEGLLPTDSATGYFGGLTLAGVHAFQNKYAAEILTPLGLTAPTDFFGSQSMAEANVLCSSAS